MRDLEVHESYCRFAAGPVHAFGTWLRGCPPAARGPLTVRLASLDVPADEAPLLAHMLACASRMQIGTLCIDAGDVDALRPQLAAVEAREVALVLQFVPSAGSVCQVGVRLQVVAQQQQPGAAPLPPGGCTTASDTVSVNTSVERAALGRSAGIGVAAALGAGQQQQQQHEEDVRAAGGAVGTLEELVARAVGVMEEQAVGQAAAGAQGSGGGVRRSSGLGTADPWGASGSGAGSGSGVVLLHGPGVCALAAQQTAPGDTASLEAALLQLVRCCGCCGGGGSGAVGWEYLVLPGGCGVLLGWGGEGPTAAAVVQAAAAAAMAPRLGGARAVALPYGRLSDASCELEECVRKVRRGWWGAGVGWGGGCRYACARRTAGAAAGRGGASLVRECTWE